MIFEYLAQMLLGRPKKIHFFLVDLFWAIIIIIWKLSFIVDCVK